jgi:hypothetical protein
MSAMNHTQNAEHGGPGSSQVTREELRLAISQGWPMMVSANPIGRKWSRIAQLGAEVVERIVAASKCRNSLIINPVNMDRIAISKAVREPTI